MFEIQNNANMRQNSWKAGHSYGKKCKCSSMSGEKKLCYVQPDRTPSFRPERVYRKMPEKMPHTTTYNMSYESVDPSVLRNCRGVPAIIKGNLTSAGEFSGDTTQRMSYGAWPGITRQKGIFPRDHNLLGEGPMQMLTTNRHDYTPKPFCSITRVIPPAHLGLSKAPMEKNSIMMMSFKSPDFQKFCPPQSFKPQAAYLPPDSPIECRTIQKMSYMPWEPQPKEDLPWAKRNDYCPPSEPVDTSTVYSNSYMPPGKFVENDHGHCQGCYCMFPAECFDTSGSTPDTKYCPEGFDPDHDPPRPPPCIDESA